MPDHDLGWDPRQNSIYRHRFDETTIRGCLDKAQAAIRKAEELRGQAQGQLDKGHRWIELYELLDRQGVQSVAELAEEDQERYRRLLEEYITVTI